MQMRYLPLTSKPYRRACCGLFEDTNFSSRGRAMLFDDCVFRFLNHVFNLNNLSMTKNKQGNNDNGINQRSNYP